MSQEKDQQQQQQQQQQQLPIEDREQCSNDSQADQINSRSSSFGDDGSGGGSTTAATSTIGQRISARFRNRRRSSSRSHQQQQQRPSSSSTGSTATAASTAATTFSSSLPAAAESSQILAQIEEEGSAILLRRPDRISVSYCNYNNNDKKDSDAACGEEEAREEQQGTAASNQFILGDGGREKIIPWPLRRVTTTEDDEVIEIGDMEEENHSSAEKEKRSFAFSSSSIFCNTSNPSALREDSQHSRTFFEPGDIVEHAISFSSSCNGIGGGVVDWLITVVCDDDNNNVDSGACDAAADGHSGERYHQDVEEKANVSEDVEPKITAANNSDGDDDYNDNSTTAVNSVACDDTDGNDQDDPREDIEPKDTTAAAFTTNSSSSDSKTATAAEKMIMITTVAVSTSLTGTSRMPGCLCQAVAIWSNDTNTITNTTTVGNDDVNTATGSASGGGDDADTNVVNDNLLKSTKTAGQHSSSNMENEEKAEDGVNKKNIIDLGITFGQDKNGRLIIQKLGSCGSGDNNNGIGVQFFSSFSSNNNGNGGGVAVQEGHLVVGINEFFCATLLPVEAHAVLDAILAEANTLTTSSTSQISITTIATRQSPKRTKWAKVRRSVVAAGGGTMVATGSVLMVTPLHPVGHALALGGVGVLGTEFEAPKKAWKSVKGRLNKYRNSSSRKQQQKESGNGVVEENNPSGTLD